MELDAQKLPNISPPSSNQDELDAMEPRMDPDVEVDAVSNGENDQQHLDDWLKTAGEDATRWVQEHRPSVAEAELDDRLPRAPSQFDETYTADDEAKLQYDWQQDLLRPHILNHGDNSVMTRLWKMTQRLWPGTYPGVLISRANMLEHDPDPNVHHITVNKTRVKNPYWSKVFCQGLETVLVHPLWDGDVANMIIFIQYAVICRTNDQRGSQWPRENPTRDLLFETFRQHTANIHHDMESVVDLHQRALRGLGNVSSKASKLLLAIEAAAFDAVTEPFLPSEPIAPYKVCTKDLQAILTALQNLTVNGVPMYLPPSTYLDMISKAIRKSQTSPSDAKLEEYRDRVLLDMRRTEKRNDNVLRIIPQHARPGRRTPHSRRCHNRFETKSVKFSFRRTTGDGYSESARIRMRTGL